MPFTEQQSGVINFEGEDLAVKSGAGTGKTTTIRGYAEKNPHIRMLYLCYNKAIQLEAQSKFPANVICRTMHAIAFARCGKNISHKLTGNLRLTDIKKFINTPSWQVTKDVNTILNNFLSSSSPAIGEEHASFVLASTQRQKARRLALIKEAKKLWDASIDPASEFPATHDVYLKLYCLLPPEMHKWFGAILFDEAQDANPVVSDFVYRQNCKHIVVGDDNQQLYRWRGANNSIDAFIKAKKATVMVMNKSFRFGANIAKLATSLLDYKSTETGSDPFPIYGNETIDDLITDAFDQEILKKHHARLHRTVTGTIKTALDHIQKKIFWVGGIDNYNLQELLDVYHLSVGEKERVKRRKLLTEYKSFIEYQGAAKDTEEPEMKRIVKLIDQHGSSLVHKISVLRKNACKEEKDAVMTISTAHRSKGLEWDTVIIAEDFRDLLDPDVDIDSDTVADELNLLYVASTRAMKNLQPNNLILAIVKLVNNGLPDYLKKAGVTVKNKPPVRHENKGKAKKQRVRLSKD